ncbi:MAG: aminotransferase class III-fold pyridoxal phosphate-dependent enzyme [Synergistaceae bacterium]|nr:aminotransferase class III-fold pyridoxal phosphate-dependent enzyme [Synergistaceae bacterium]
MSGALSRLYGGRGLALTGGDGAFVTDAGGRRYIDFFNGHGAALFGHANPELTGALREAAAGLWSCGAGYESPVREELAAALGGRLGDGRVFLCNSGTEAIEAALKLAVSLRSGRSELIACRRGFHGRSCGALGLTFNPKYRAPFASLIPAVKHYAPEDIAAKISDDTAVVFIEPVQGEGGVYPISEEVGRAISDSCREHGALLAADEVQCGLGRCGSFFASPRHGLRPDIIALAKGLAGGLPAGAMIWRGELGDFPPHSHGSTYGGNELTARVSLAALKLIEEKKLCSHAEALGCFIRSEIERRAIPGIHGVRGDGLLIGAESELPSQDIVRSLQNNGLLALPAGPRVVRLLPSFAATEEIAAEGIDILERTMKELLAAKGVA